MSEENYLNKVYNQLKKNENMVYYIIIDNFYFVYLSKCSLDY